MHSFCAIGVRPREKVLVPALATEEERIVWEGYPSWKQFSWLYFFIGLALYRGGLFYAFDLPTGEVWLAGALFLALCVVLIRRWAQYFVTSSKVGLRNGYTGREIDAIPLNQIQEVTIKQGPLAGFFEIGTLEICKREKGGSIRFRGIKDPEVIKNKVDAIRPDFPENT